MEYRLAIYRADRAITLTTEQHIHTQKTISGTTPLNTIPAIAPLLSEELCEPLSLNCSIGVRIRCAANLVLELLIPSELLNIFVTIGFSVELNESIEGIASDGRPSTIFYIINART